MTWKHHDYPDGSFLEKIEVQDFSEEICQEALERLVGFGRAPDTRLFVERIDACATMYFAKALGGDWKAAVGICVMSLVEKLGEDAFEEAFVGELCKTVVSLAPRVAPGVVVSIHDSEDESPVCTYGAD